MKMISSTTVTYISHRPASMEDGRKYQVLTVLDDDIKRTVDLWLPADNPCASLLSDRVMGDVITLTLSARRGKDGWRVSVWSIDI